MQIVTTIEDTFDVAFYFYEYIFKQGNFFNISSFLLISNI